MRIYNGEEIAITVVSDGNADVVIPAKSFATIEIDHVSVNNQEGIHQFGSDSFYIQEDGAWYATEAGHTGADLEIYAE